MMNHVVLIIMEVIDAAVEVLAAKTVRALAHAAAAKNLPVMTMPTMTMPKKCSPLPMRLGWKF